MKKIALFTILGLMAVFAFANGGGEDSADVPFIGVSVPSADHGWTGAVIDYAEEALEMHAVDGKVATAADVNKQASDLENLVALGADAIVILPLEGSPLTPAAEATLEAGVPVINFDRELDNETYTALVKGDNEGIGINGARWLIDKLGGEGKVFMLSGPPVSVTTQRDNGFTETIKGTGIEVVGLQDGGYQRGKGYTVMQNALTAYPEIDAVFAIDDEMALGALQAIKEAGRTDIKYITGAGGEKTFFEAIMEEKDIEMATFLYMPSMIQDSIKVAVDMLTSGDEPTKVTVIPATRVDRSNVKDFYDANAPY